MIFKIEVMEKVFMLTLKIFFCSLLASSSAFAINQEHLTSSISVPVCYNRTHLAMSCGSLLRYGQISNIGGLTLPNMLGSPKVSKKSFYNQFNSQVFISRKNKKNQ